MAEHSRIAGLRKILDRNPNDTRALFGLSNEYEKLEQWDDVVDHLARYLQHAEDEGNAWGRLGRALRVSGRAAEARAAYTRGIEVARAHGHPSMAAEFEEVLENWD